MNRRQNNINLFGSLALTFLAPFALGFFGFPFAVVIFTAALSLKWTQWMHEPSRLQEMHLLARDDDLGAKADALVTGLVNDIFMIFGFGSIIYLAGTLTAHFLSIVS